jgi:hypothetical protein
MNPIEQLRAAKPAHLDPDPRVDEMTRARELSYALSQARTVRSHRRLTKPVWGLGLVGAAAAVTAVAVTLSGGTGGTGGTGSGTVAVTSAPGGAQTGTTKAPQTSLDARTILLTAAHTSEVQPEKVGKYWHSSTISKHLENAGSYSVFIQGKSEMWTPFATGVDSWTREQNLGAVPASPADEAAWKAAGSPTKIKIKKAGADDSPSLGDEVLSTAPGAVRTNHQPLTQGDKIFWLGKNVTMKDVRGLPSSPGALKQWLLNSYEGHGTESSSDKMSADVWLFTVTTGLITDMPVTPKVRGAAFRMLAALKSLKVTENVRDSSGRVGTAVTLTTISKAKSTDSDKTAGSYEDRLIFDKATGLPLAREGVVIKPGGLQAALKPGTLFFSTLVQNSGWTDSTPS